MRAAVIDPYRHTLEISTVTDPEPLADEVLVKVAAAGLNRADLAARAGIYRSGAAGDAPPPAFVGGAEFSGEVIEVGAGVTQWQVGDLVMGRGRGYAELVTAPANQLVRVPGSLNLDEAGGLPLPLFTAHNSLATNGLLEPGQVVVVNAATSGVGLATIQMAAHLGAGAVIATSRSAEKLRILSDHVSSLPCPLIAVDVSSHNVVDATLEFTSGHGADLVIDHVGAAAVEENLALAKITGRIVQVGRLGGKVATINLDEVARKRLTIVGVTFRTRTRPEVESIVRDCVESVGSKLEDFRPRIHQRYALDDVLAAQDAMAQNLHVGKLIVVP